MDAHVFRDRREIVAHLEEGHDWKPDPKDTDHHAWLRADGGFVVSDSELLAIHYELERIAALPPRAKVIVVQLPDGSHLSQMDLTELRARMNAALDEAER